MYTWLEVDIGQTQIHQEAVSTTYRRIPGFRAISGFLTPLSLHLHVPHSALALLSRPPVPPLPQAVAGSAKCIKRHCCLCT